MRYSRVVWNCKCLNHSCLRWDEKYCDPKYKDTWDDAYDQLNTIKRRQEKYRNKFFTKMTRYMRKELTNEML